MNRNMYQACAAFAAFCLIGSALLPTAVQAQKTPTVALDTAVAPSIAGNTLDKKPFDLQSLKGKVVMVMFWSTDCAVCRDKMSELRQNSAGWADKPFELVLISVDRSMKDVNSYAAILNKSVTAKQRFTQLWAGDSAYKDNLATAQLSRSQLPTTLLIDKSGKLVERYNGRIPAEVWDTISDLL
jgi:thiol-disulfide isomerase/thioredoxin